MLTFNKSRNDSQMIARGKAEIDLEHEAYRALSSRRKTPADAEAASHLHGAVVKRAIVVLDAQGNLEARFQSMGLLWGRAIDGASMAYGYSQARVLTAGEIAHHSVGPDKELSAHFAASVFMGSTLSQLRQRSSDLPVRSVVAISRFSHFGQRIASMESSRL